MKGEIVTRTDNGKKGRILTNSDRIPRKEAHLFKPGPDGLLHLGNGKGNKRKKRAGSEEQ